MVIPIFPGIKTSTQFSIYDSNNKLSPVYVELNADDPTQPITLKEYGTNNIIGTWSKSGNKWISVADIETSLRFPDQANTQSLNNPTITVIKSLTEEQQNAYATAEAFKPYNTNLKTVEQTISQNNEIISGLSNSDNTEVSSSIRVRDFNPNELKNLKNISPDFEDYKYPLQENSNDKIIFRPMELNLESGVVSASGNANFGLTYNTDANRRTFKSVSNGGSVKLGIQGPISDQNLVNWQEGRVGPLDAILYNSAMGALKDKSDFMGALQGGGENLIKNTETVVNNLFSTGIYRQLFASLAANNTGLFNRATSLSINPNIELLFNEPQLRPFQFTFLLSAVEPKESVQIKNIIRFFKYHMAAKVPNTIGLFLRTPHVFSIEYQNGNTGAEHQSIGRIAPNNQNKACALTDFSVDYTPLGSYMTYKDSSMVAYRINMTFREIVPVYDVDYVDNHPIGY